MQSKSPLTLLNLKNIFQELYDCFSASVKHLGILKNIEYEFETTAKYVMGKLSWYYHTNKTQLQTVCNDLFYDDINNKHRF